MQALIDTNILIRHDGKSKPHRDTDKLYSWLQKAEYEKCILHTSWSKINTYSRSLKQNYVIVNEHPLGVEVSAVASKMDENEEDCESTQILNILSLNIVDIVITESAKTHLKAQMIGVSERVFTISAFLEKCFAEHPEWVDYNVLSVRRKKFSDIRIEDPFFDSLKESYSEFTDWFVRKSNDYAYVSSYKDKILAFLYLKIEDEFEKYDEFVPPLPPKKRLKIGTFKVESTGFKLGERFLKIVFDNAIRFSVEEIYVTIFDKDEDTHRLIETLEMWGFEYYGVKRGLNGEESVFVRKMACRYEINRPRSTYPFFSRSARTFLLAIFPEYHTELLPDSLLRNEKAEDFEDGEPHRNAISKVFISRSIERNLKMGDLILFYRTGGLHKGVVTTVGIVEEVVTDITDQEDFIRKCRKRSVFTDEKLCEYWNYKPSNRPFIINFMYVYTFPHRMNLEALINAGIIADVNSAPRGLTKISKEMFNRILIDSKADPAVIAD